MLFDYGEENNLNLKAIIVLGRMRISMDAVLGKSIQATGLTIGQFGVLEALYHKGPLTVNQIIEKTLSSSGNMGVVIENLIKNGMIIKRVAPDDKRSRIIEISEKGKQLIKGFFPDHIIAIERCLSGLSTEEKRQLILLAKKLGKNTAV